MATPKPPATPVALLLRKHFPGNRFRSDHLKMVGRVLKKNGENAAVEYLTGKQEDTPPNFNPPAKCNIVGQSRPFGEWAIHLASAEIQKYVYGLTVEERQRCEPGTSKESHTRWLTETGVQTFGYTSVQGLNLIFKHTLNRYDGVIKKVERRNEHRLAKQTRIAEARAAEGLPPLEVDAPETAIGEDGRLLQPPGINHSIYCYAGVSPRAYVPGSKDLPAKYAEYNRDPNAPIASAPDRLAIPEGQPGHVPEWQRLNLSPKKHKRMRAWWSRTNWKPKPGRKAVADEAHMREVAAKGAILVLISIGEDWLVADVRGLLRNVLWRRLAKPGISLNDLLGLFSGDPVIDPKRGVVTFTYKLGVVKVHSRKPTMGRKSKELLLRMTAPHDDHPIHVGMVAIDLGQTNPVAALYSRVGRDSKGDLHAETLNRSTLPADLLQDIARYRRACDLLEEQLRGKATAALTDAQRSEIAQLERSAEDARGLVLDLGAAADLPWDAMTSYTTHISDYLVAHDGNVTNVFFDVRDGKATKTIKRSDKGWAMLTRPRLSPETRKALNDKLWELKRTSQNYGQLSQRKIELARRCVNLIVMETKRLSQCDDIVVVLENLNVRFFHGGGKRAPGWANFFVAKRENRWFIQVLHKAFSDLAIHRGLMVVEVNPARTSITCLACGHCDSKNRDGEKFQCVACGDIRHADLEVATTNLTRVAITGEPMPKPVREPPTDAKKVGPARKRKPANLMVNPSPGASEVPASTP
jgi:putative transposase-like DNA-binding protein